MKTAFTLLAALAVASHAQAAFAQSYPTRTVRIIVPYAAGGNTDITARAIGSKLTDVFGQQVIVDNRPGGATNIGSELAARAAPDGYTLFMGGASNAVNMSLYSKPPYDTMRYFAPITLCVKGANVLSIHPSLPVKTLKELIALAKARPGQLNFASSGIGSSNRMAGELLKVMAGINIVHVPYKGAALALQAMLSGEVDMVTSTVPATIPLVNAGKIRALAVMAPTRVAALPKVPTTAEAGMPELVVITWYGLFAPAGVKPEIIERLNAEVVRLMNAPETRSRLAKVELDAATSTPAEFAKFVRAESEKWARVIKDANIRVQQ